MIVFCKALPDRQSQDETGQRSGKYGKCQRHKWEVLRDAVYLPALRLHPSLGVLATISDEVQARYDVCCDLLGRWTNSLGQQVVK